MTKVIAVIGSGYGDEGKGLMTDYYASQYDNAVVVRSNGGAQAGHTVTTPDGERNVFSHFGSGSLAGATTFLSEHFVANPLLFRKEHETFVERFGFAPKIYVNGSCVVTTPFDMLLNQAYETMRGDDKHGSVGVGFGETIERGLLFDTLYFVDIMDYYDRGALDDLAHFLETIRDEYVPQRVDMNKVTDDFLNLLNSKEIISDFLDACVYMRKHTDYAWIGNFTDNTLIFEGAQGLLLDMDYGYFPYVTRSNCGMRNISDILHRNLPIDEFDLTVNYVTRAYTTRHGAGPLNNEDERIFFRHNIVDETNKPNDWQGSLRVAPLDMDLFNSVTDKDFLNYAPRGSKKVTTVTCLDQLDGEVTWYAKGQKRFMSANTARDRAGELFNYGSFGPNRTSIKEYTK